MASFIGRAMMLMLVLSFLAIACDANWTKHVRVTNQLQGITLKVHCKSADDDLGLKTLNTNNFFEFSFKSAFVGDTDFYCSFEWPGSFKWFDVYVGPRDLHDCDQCWWSVRNTEYGPQPCRLDTRTGQYVICKPWNPPPPK